MLSHRGRKVGTIIQRSASSPKVRHSCTTIQTALLISFICCTFGSAISSWFILLATLHSKIWFALHGQCPILCRTLTEHPHQGTKENSIYSSRYPATGSRTAALNHCWDTDIKPNDTEESMVSWHCIFNKNRRMFCKVFPE